MRAPHLSKTLLIVIAALLTGCSSRPSYVPSNDEMASLLYDIHLMESCFRLSYVKDTKEKGFLYSSILSDHDMTPEMFDSCIKWFSNNRREYKVVYNIVETRLNREKNSILAGKFLLLREDYPGELFYSTYNVLPRDMETLQKMNSLRDINGEIYTPDAKDSTYINLSEEIPDVPYRIGGSPKRPAAELGTNDGGSHPYVERL